MNDAETLFESWVQFLKDNALDINLYPEEATLLVLTDEQRKSVQYFVQKWEEL